jgi:hypothetical protein
MPNPTRMTPKATQAVQAMPNPTKTAQKTTVTNPVRRTRRTTVTNPARRTRRATWGWRLVKHAVDQRKLTRFRGLPAHILASRPSAPSRLDHPHLSRANCGVRPALAEARRWGYRLILRTSGLQRMDPVEIQITQVDMPSRSSFL